MAGNRIPSGAYPLGFPIDDGSGGKAYATAFVQVDAQGNTAGSGTSSAPTYTTTANYTPKSPAQQITIATLATAQSLTVPSGSTIARIQNNTSQPLRWRDDGTAPTTTTGQRLASGATLIYDGNLAAFQTIREADGTGTLDVGYYA